MYVGRIVAVARARDGRVAALYRVSSRSFPNRTARVLAKSALIVPAEGYQDDIYKNPYIAYACARVVGLPADPPARLPVGQAGRAGRRGLSAAAGEVAVVGNGSQTDAIAEKIALGTPVRDAIADVLLALDYEKDKYNTPRIAGAIARGAEAGFLGVVRKDGVNVREIPIPAGKAFYVATYEIDDVDPNRRGDFDARDASGGARFVVESGVFASLTNPVAAVCAMEGPSGFEIAAYTVPRPGG
jgi:IMP cyclohydrolase